MTIKTFICAILASTSVLASFPASAQMAGITVKPLLNAGLSGDDTRQTTIQMVEIAAGAALPTHTHSGDEYVTVLEGTLELRVEGQEPQRVNAGESFHNPRGVIHQTRNVGDGIVRLINTLVHDRNQPLIKAARMP